MSTLFVIGQVVLGGYFAIAGIKHFTGAKGMTGYAAMKGFLHHRQASCCRG